MLNEAEKQAYRRRELDLLDYLDAALSPQIEQGNPHAIATALKISQSRARLLGRPVIKTPKAPPETAEVSRIYP